MTLKQSDPEKAYHIALTVLYLEYRHLGLEVQFITDYNFFYLLAYKGTFLCNVKLIEAINKNWFYIRFG